MHTFHHDQENDIKRLAKLVNGIEFAMMTTVSEEDGHLRSRPMTLQQAAFGSDGDFWFFTGRSTTPALDIEANSLVNLAFAQPNHSSYVSVCGHAEVVNDPAKAAELWSPLLKAWFPRGLDDPELTLLRVHVESADYWESPSSKVVQLLGFAKAIIKGERAGNTMGFHRHLELGKHQ